MATRRSSPAQKKEIETLREEIRQKTGKTPEELYEEARRKSETQSS